MVNYSLFLVPGTNRTSKLRRLLKPVSDIPTTVQLYTVDWKSPRMTSEVLLVGARWTVPLQETLYRWSESVPDNLFQVRFTWEELISATLNWAGRSIKCTVCVRVCVCMCVCNYVCAFIQLVCGCNSFACHKSYLHVISLKLTTNYYFFWRNTHNWVCPYTHKPLAHTNAHKYTQYYYTHMKGPYKGIYMYSKGHLLG